MNSTPSPTSFILKPGIHIGDNIIINPIAEGGMAHIYKVKNELLEVFRVIKLLKPGSDIDSERFLTEAKIHANLNHPNIVQCYNFGKYKDVIPYIEMEYVNGINLYHLIHKHGRIPVEVVMSIIYFVCKALAALHNCSYTLYNVKRSGVVHRDIKPSNIIISNEGTVKLADFGIAKPKDLSIHTSEVQVVGSIYYLSPEQLKKEDLDFSTDIYSLGCVIYEMITSIKAFDHNNISDIVMAKVKNSYSAKPLKNCPEKVKQLIVKSLYSNKNERYKTIEEVLKAIEAILRDLSIENPERVIRQYMQNPKHFYILFEQLTNKNDHPKKFIRLIPLLVIITIATSFGILFLIKREKNSRTDSAAAPPAISFAPAQTESGESPVAAPDKKDAIPVVRPPAPADKKPVPVTATTAGKTPFEPAYTAFMRTDFAQCIRLLSDKNDLSDTLFLCYLGSLEATGNFGKVSQIIHTRTVHDGYYHYLKGKIAYAAKDYDAATGSFMKSLTTRSFYKNLHYYANYYLAKSKTEIYLKVPSVENKARMIKSLESFVASFCANPAKPECDDINRLIGEFE